jgi:hypothetical protein
MIILFYTEVGLPTQILPVNIILEVGQSEHILYVNLLFMCITGTVTQSVC